MISMNDNPRIAYKKGFGSRTGNVTYKPHMLLQSEDPYFPSNKSIEDKVKNREGIPLRALPERGDKYPRSININKRRCEAYDASIKETEALTMGGSCLMLSIFFNALQEIPTGAFYEGLQPIIESLQYPLIDNLFFGLAFVAPGLLGAERLSGYVQNKIRTSRNIEIEPPRKRKMRVKKNSVIDLTPIE